MKIVYDWLKEYVGKDIPSIEKLDELFTFHAFEIDGIEKVGNHEVIDVKVLPDRSSDCLSHRGIARELSAIIGRPLAHDPLLQSVTLTPVTENIHVTIEDAEQCRRFAGALITGVTVKESPDWLKERLSALGQRPINNIVDATNYVMFALGQPLHAYDANTFESKDGVWHFGVRMSKAGEEVMTLSGETLTLTEGQVQLIVNGATDTPVGIAGIKGGKSAEITEGTTTIILESANFNPQVTRKASQALRLQTDASKRFENNLSPELVPYGLEACVDLILKIAGGACTGYVDVFPYVVARTSVTVSLTQIQSLLGITLPDAIVEDIFTRLGFTYIREGGAWQVTAPFERTDITIPEDVIAEVGRIYGYEHVTAVVPETVPLTEYNTRYYYGEKIKDLLISEGFSEVITSSFRKKDTIELQNALASDKKFLRSSLRENIQDVLDKNIQNIDLLGVPYIQVFEMGTVFTKTEDGTDVTEHVALALGVRMKQTGHTPKDDARVMEVAKRLETELGVSLNATSAGGIIECNLQTRIKELPVPQAYEPYGASPAVQYVPYSLYPYITRDIALWTPETVSSSEIESVLRKKAGGLLVRLALFDEFKKDGRVSYAFRLVFQSTERTLTDDEIGTIMEGVYTEMKARGFETR